MNNFSLHLLTAAFCLYACPVTAQDVASADTPLPPTIIEQSETVAPQVTVIRRQNETVTEYRQNGQLYLVRIVPDSGYPYYLVDQDGDGVLESSFYALDEASLVNQWILFSW